MFDENFERKFNSTELAVWKSFISLVCGLLGNREKIPQNLTKFVTELPEARVADVTENSHLHTYTTASILTS
jgi:hypothetical protein